MHHIKPVFTLWLRRRLVFRVSVSLHSQRMQLRFHLIISSLSFSSFSTPAASHSVIAKTHPLSSEANTFCFTQI
ncbi:hypothetical protein EXN66_Car005970 [Channa argus]|uniref:Uncharacterized protein n=1 Tax=Channa argus TaxID=215402 RepID=A0A6G1PJX8_CHAAH|nr:hypothetical protein EXN66_Car005970 [Channa argus]